MKIRCDDYPYGDPRHLSKLGKKLGYSSHQAGNILRSLCLQIMEIFEKENIEYLWGVSPCLFIPGDIEALNKTVKCGKLVTHGFDHGVSVIPVDRWHEIHSIYDSGGEFMYYDSKPELEKDFNIAHEIMSQLKRYDSTVFIPPFNAYNQIFLDVAANIGRIKTLMICETEYEKFLKKLNHWDLDLSISSEGKSYDSVVRILKNWDDLVNTNPDHICLHPIYDAIDMGGIDVIHAYTELAARYRILREGTND